MRSSVGSLGSPEVRPAQLELTAIDVSQGDSLLVVFPDGETMLVDAGGFPGFERMKRKPQLDIGEDVVSPYLWSRRIQRLDYAVLTHGHSDHMGGLAAILNNFRPRKLWIGAEPKTPAWKAIKRTAAQDNVPIVALNRASAHSPSVAQKSVYSLRRRTMSLAIARRTTIPWCLKSVMDAAAFY